MRQRASLPEVLEIMKTRSNRADILARHLGRNGISIVLALFFTMKFIAHSGPHLFGNKFQFSKEVDHPGPFFEVEIFWI